MPAFSRTSLERLSTCHPLLQQLFNEVIRHRDCTVLCGHRGKQEQEQAVRDGFSKAKFGQSRHNYSPSLAADVMPYPIDWQDKQRIKEFSEFVKGLAAGMNIPIQWGGDFRSFYDAPHWELIGNFHEAKIPDG